MTHEPLTAIALAAAADFRALNGGRALTAPEAEDLVAHIAFRTVAGRRGAFTGQSAAVAVAAILGAR